MIHHQSAVQLFDAVMYFKKQSLIGRLKGERWTSADQQLELLAPTTYTCDEHHKYPPDSFPRTNGDDSVRFIPITFRDASPKGVEERLRLMDYSASELFSTTNREGGAVGGPVLSPFSPQQRKAMIAKFKTVGERAEYVGRLYKEFVEGTDFEFSEQSFRLLTDTLWKDFIGFHPAITLSRTYYQVEKFIPDESENRERQFATRIYMNALHLINRGHFYGKESGLSHDFTRQILRGFETLRYMQLTTKSKVKFSSTAILELGRLYYPINEIVGLAKMLEQFCKKDLEIDEVKEAVSMIEAALKAGEFVIMDSILHAIKRAKRSNTNPELSL